MVLLNPYESINKKILMIYTLGEKKQLVRLTDSLPSNLLIVNATLSTVDR